MKHQLTFLFFTLATFTALELTAADSLPHSSPAGPSAITTPAANDDVRKVTETFAARGIQRDDTPPTSPKESLRTYSVREGFALDLMASEPDVMQPLYMSWDSRGRMWVLEYLQYQFPAGLKVISYDQHLRAQFDKVPEPPPRGVKGADRVSVFEDSKGSGFFDSHKVALAGLNMATAAIKGAGGIWVMNPPYLLFYPDANDDDIPDGDPQVLLSGFGMEDTHSMANSLRWGPDGWLYGANGSTTTGDVSSAVSKHVKFQGQHIWRFHPKTKIFEIYAEGGGNTFSTEIDAQGRVFSGTNGKDRGMHYDQGMSGTKAFGKHGPPLNPYAFGYFDHMETKSDGKRFSQALAVYDGGLMPELEGRILAANAMQNLCYVSRRIPSTSTFRTEDEPELLHSSDRWFRPVDLKVGPDGCVYFADWYDTRLSHVRPIDDWSKNDGRIYRVRPKGVEVGLKPFNLHTAPVVELVANLKHANKWFRDQSALELNWRGETSALPDLQKLACDVRNPHALDALFALHMLGGLSESIAIELLQHPDPYVRRWVVRCIGDEGETTAPLTTALNQLAAKEGHPEVRTQLLCSAKRLPAKVALPVVRTMMERDADATDQRIPLLLWWAIEAKAESDRDAVLSLFRNPEVWNLKLARTFSIQNLAKRYALAGGKENFESCARLLSLATRNEDRSLVIEGIAAAFEGGKMPELPATLSDAVESHMKSQMDGDLALAVKTGSSDAFKKALGIVADKKAPMANRATLIRALAEVGGEKAVPGMLGILSSSGEVGLKKVVLSEAARFDEPKIAQTVVTGYESRFAGEPGLRDAAIRMLAARKEWAQLLLNEVDNHRVKAAHVAPDVLQQIALYQDAAIDALIQKHWPPANLKLNNAQKLAELQRLKSLAQTAPGDMEKGHELFTQRCSACHTLFHEGGKVGPELTGYERNNMDFWLVAILEPSLEIREGFSAYICKLKDGRILMGTIDKQDAGGVVIKDVAGQRHTLRQLDIESLEASPTSLMPEGLLGGLNDTQLSDLFAYLRKP